MKLPCPMPRAALTVLLLLSPCFASAAPGAGIPLSVGDDNSYVTTNWGQGDYTLTCLPDGSGAPLSLARDSAGNHVDCTIHVYLRSLTNVPYVGVPAELISVRAGHLTNGLYGCGAVAAGDHIILAHADRPTDGNGYTTISGPLAVGGCTAAYPDGLVLIVETPGPGGAIDGPHGTLGIISPDLFADGVVDLSDVSLFSTLFGGYDGRADFDANGVVGLSDLVVFSEAVGATCEP